MTFLNIFLKQNFNYCCNSTVKIPRTVSTFEMLGKFLFLKMNVKTLTFTFRTVSILNLSVLLVSAIKEDVSASWTPRCNSKNSRMNTLGYHPLLHVTLHKSVEENEVLGRFQRQISAPLAPGYKDRINISRNVRSSVTLWTVTTEILKTYLMNGTPDNPA